MAKQQDHDQWIEAQKIVISTNLVAGAKKHVRFLQVVDENGKLYDGPILEKAIFRYKYCWLPLLAKHTEAKLPKCQLVVPLDCEWIWHCHRLNPVQYMADCKKLFGRILYPGCVVVSSIEETCNKQTEEIWKKQYPEEPYQLDYNDELKNDTESKLTTLPSTNYDLTSAVKRQSSFYHKVSGLIMRGDNYLAEAVERYKGFLHLVKLNMEMKSNNACVPTYDIDLMWHTHQLHSLSYCKDCLALVGQVLHHDDTDSDQSEGGKLDVGIKTTTKQWAEMFGSWYWKAGSRETTKGMEVEKSSAMTARCWCAADVKNGEKLTAVTSRCWCAADIKNGEILTAMTARCWCAADAMNGEKLTAVTSRCWCAADAMNGEKLTAVTSRCWCAADATNGEKLTAIAARCKADGINGEKLNTKCRVMMADDINGEKLTTMTARCMAARCMANGMDGEKLTSMSARCMCAKQCMDTAPQASGMMVIT